MNDIPKDLEQYVFHGQEETYLEYKGDVPWGDNNKKLEIVKSIFSLSNNDGGGIIVVGIDKDGTLVGLSEDNFNSYKHDEVSNKLKNKGNQTVECRVEKYIHQGKNLVIMQVSEKKEFPLVYTADSELNNPTAEAYPKNIALRKGALYIRSKAPVGNKEIETHEEWQELIERTYRKYEKESLKRGKIISGSESKDYDNETTI